MNKLLVLCGLFLLLPFASYSQQKNRENESIDEFAEDRQRSLDSVVVSAARAGDKTPIAHTTIKKDAIRQSATSHSLPMILSLQPSVVATTEGGLGLGYSKLSVRGSDGSRINITLNGIAINDGESQEVFWVNLPSIQNFLSSVQLQRGVGTSANGPAAFGASVNMNTVSGGSDAYGNAEFSLGSYQTYMTTISAGSGLSKHGFSFDFAYSHNNSRGYIRNAKADLNSLFVSMGWQNACNSLKLNYIFGDQSTGITWEGISLEDYYSNRRYNPAGEYYDDAGNVHYYDNETDNYRQHYIQGIYTHRFSDALVWSTTLNFTKGDGYYENYKYDTKYSKYSLSPQVVGGVTYESGDFIIQKAMDNEYFAGITSLSYSADHLNITGGISYSIYSGDHFGDMIWAKYNQNIPDNYRWYFNNGRKGEFSAYARGEWNISGPVTLFADLQYRHIGYELEGSDDDDVALDSEYGYDFFNPKAGVTFNVGRNSKFYASLSVGHREPSRADIKESIKSGKADLIKNERLLDYELGYSYASSKVALGVNLYFMEYDNQLVSTGKLSESGYVIKENIPDSYRRGVELSIGWQALRSLRFDANLTLSRNKLRNYTLYIDTYDNDNDWNPVEQTEMFLKKSNLTLSPEIISMAMATFAPAESLSFSLIGKYVGEQYMDNSSLDIARVPGYFTASFNANKEFTLKNSSRIRLQLCVDNLFNNKYYSYGWIYYARFANGAPDYVEEGVYPQALINFTARIAYSF